MTLHAIARHVMTATGIIKYKDYGNIKNTLQL